MTDTLFIRRLIGLFYSYSHVIMFFIKTSSAWLELYILVLNVTLHSTVYTPKIIVKKIQKGLKWVMNEYALIDWIFKIAYSLRVRELYGNNTVMC